MSRTESLIVAYLLDGKGSGKKITWKEIEQWAPDTGQLWVHLNYTSNRTSTWLNKNTHINPMAARTMTVEESRPRSVIYPDGLLMFLRGVNLNPGQDPEDMVSIRIWLSQQCIITTRKRRLLSIDDVRRRIEEGRGPCSTVELFRMLNERLIDRMADVIENIEEQVDSLEEEVVYSESRLLRPKIADLRRQSIMIRRYLAPQREALNKIFIDESLFFSQIDKLHIREATDRIIRYIENLDSARERATITQEELTSRISEQLDKRMYVLSLVAVIFLPLTFITGLLGINVGGIPGAENKWAFMIVSGMLVLLGVVLCGLCYKKKWM